MFTGIIEAVGQIQSMQPSGGDVRLYVKTGKLDLGDVKLGDSIAVNGVCLTAVELPASGPMSVRRLFAVLRCRASNRAAE